jgi:hypothetical protein
MCDVISGDGFAIYVRSMSCGLLTALKNKLNDNYALYCKDEAIKDDTKPNGGKLRVYNKIKCNFKMEKYLLFNGDRSHIQCSVSHDCGSVPIDSVLKEVDTAKIHFHMLSGFVYTVKRLSKGGSRG